MEKDHIKVACPHCGDEMDIPYVYDGTYEIKHKRVYTKCPPKNNLSKSTRLMHTDIS